MPVSEWAPVAILLFCGIAAFAIATVRGLDPWKYGLLGLLLIGVILAAVAKPEPMSAGWYPDPWRSARLRWHDGRDWTGHTSS